MNLSGRVIRVHLSNSGKEEVGSHLGENEFDAFVIGEHPVGLCLSRLGTKPSTNSRIALLKWEHFATVDFDYEPEAARPERTRPGFQP